MESVEFSGPVYTWKLKSANRKFIVVTLPFGTIRKAIKPNLYTADTGDGEQRQLFPSHVRSLCKDMVEDKYTPLPIAAGLNDTLDKIICSVTVDDKKPVVSFKVDDTTGPLSQIDGGHRFGALDKLVEKGDKEALEVPITAVIYLDNKNKENFLNAQKGRPVDKAHMLSLQVGAELNNKKIGPFLRIAMDIAKILNENDKSPFYRMIKFDSRSIAPLPISTLSAKGGSDIGTSLVGTAKLVKAAGKDAAWGAQTIIDIFQAIKKSAAKLLDLGKMLTPPPDGSRGSATMWIGIGNLLAYRRSLPDDGSDVIESLIEAVKKSCDVTVRGNFSGPKKRELLGEIAYDYYATLKGVEFFNDDIPQPLVDLLSYSTFAMKKVKQPKVKVPGAKRGRKPKAVAPAVEIQPPMTTVKEEKPDGTPVIDDFESGPAPWEQEEVQA